MYKKGHTGMIKVKRATEDRPGTLEIKVRIGGNESKTGNVKDLKQLSGVAAFSHTQCQLHTQALWQLLNYTSDIRSMHAGCSSCLTMHAVST